MRSKPNIQHVTAVVAEVLPKTGLAYLTGEDGAAWTVTKSTPGDGLAALAPGTHVDLTIKHRGGLCLVDAYTVLHLAGTTPSMTQAAVLPLNRG